MMWWANYNMVPNIHYVILPTITGVPSSQASAGFYVLSREVKAWESLGQGYSHRS